MKTGRMLHLLLAAAMIMVLATGCGGAQSSAAPAPASGSAAPAPASSSAAVDAYANWPEHEIRVVVPYQEGGSSHKVALLLKELIEKNKLLPKSIVVTCMPNAGTLEGQEEVLNAKPDGYTLLIHHNAMLNGYALGKQDYTYDDFKVISQTYSTPLAIAVRSDSPYQTLQEAVAAMKSGETKLKWAWGGLGGNTHFASYVFFDAAGIDIANINPVVTKGDNDSIVNLVGGQLDIAILQPSVLAEFIKSGDVRPLAQSGETATEIAGMSVPSWKECGYDNTYNMRVLMFGPKDLPDAITEKLDKVFAEVISSQEYIDAMKNFGFVPEYLNSADALAAFSQEADNANAMSKLMEK